MGSRDQHSSTREPISACVITFNEERKIGRCLRSLTWCDEIVVLDSHSTDRTVEIASEYTPHVYRHDWSGYVGQRNLVREMSHHPWLLFLDADEEISPELRDEILREFSRNGNKYAGYEFPRQVFYLGRWIRHGEWYPDVKVRLFRREFGRSEGEEPHDKVIVNGPVKRLRHPLWHYTYDGIQDHISTLNRFSTIGAHSKFVEEQPFRWRDLLLRPFFRFLKGYLLKAGFRDGPHGLLIACISAFSVFCKYAKLWELHRRQDGSIAAMPDPVPAKGADRQHRK